MALAIYTSAAWTNSGGLKVADNATIEVRRESDGGLASIYSDRAGTLVITNPSQFGDASGRFQFFAAGGAYRVKVSQDGEEHELRWQAIGTAGEFDLEQIQTAVNQGVYATTEDGITATADGEFFWVPDGDSLILYRNDAGSSVEILSTPNAGDVDAAIGAANQARDAATTARFIFDTTADGLANTEDGEYFTSPDAGRLVLYKNSAGAAEEILRYASSIDQDLIDTHEAKTTTHGAPTGTRLTHTGDRQYGIRYTPDVLPTLSSDFARNQHKLHEPYGLESKSLLNVWDVTRGSTGTYIDPRGVIKTAAIDEPRITFDPETGEPLGLLVEESRTNELLWSEAFDDEAWNKAGAVTLTKLAGQAPNGGDAFHVSSGGEDTNNRVEQAIIAAADTTYVATVFTRSVGSPTRVQLRATGVDPFADTTLTLWPEDSTDDWVRRELTITTDNHDELVLRVARELDGPLDVEIALAQLEAASTPSSYIPTTTAAATRDADNVVRTLGDEFNADEFTLYVEVPRQYDDRLRTVFKVTDTPDPGFSGLGLQKEADTRYRWILRTSSYIYQLADATAGDCLRCAISVDHGDVVAAINTETQGVSLTAAEFNELKAYLTTVYLVGIRLGGSGATETRSHELVSAKFYPRALTEAELIELTRID